MLPFNHNMNQYFLILICGLFQSLETQYVNLWTDNMDTNNGWTGYNNFNLTWNSNKCIIGQCGYVIADNNGPSYIEKSTNITLYSSIQFQVDITAYNMKQTDYCQMWYKFDNIAYTKYAQWSPGRYKNVRINFPPTTTVNMIYIRLQVIGNHSTCIWENTILTGIHVPVKMLNITTDSASFSISTNPPIPFTLILFIIIITSTVCCLVACTVIICLTCKKTNNASIDHEYTLCHENTNAQSLQMSMMEIMSTLELSEHDILSYQSKYSHAQITPRENHFMYSKTITNTTALKKGNYAGMNQSLFYENVSNMENPCEEIQLEGPYHHNYPTVTRTPASFGYEYVNASQTDILNGQNSLSLSKLHRLLNELECSSTDKNTYSTVETISDVDTETDTNLDTVSMFLYDRGYEESFL
eukprot:470234_1